jgi:sugar phosphate isomerase/epimerase
MRISFSTLACPTWNVNQVIDAAVQYGFDGIELRFIENDDRLWERPEFKGSGLAATKRRLGDAGLRISCVDTSCFFHHPDAQKRQASLEMGQSMIQLAAELGAPSIRVFGDRVQPGATRAATMEWVAKGVGTLGEYGRSHKVETWLETHGDFARTADTVQILQAAATQNAGAIWDPLNSFSEFGEDPGAGIATLGARLRHTHIKDARKGTTPWEPVLTGTGDFPATRVVQLLREHDFKGFISFEWEKRWHPQIAEPEVALPQFMRWIRNALAVGC